MNNKTCGECKHCDSDDFGIECCDKHGICNISKTQKACSAFEQYRHETLTNGDKIRQLSNKQLAELIENLGDECGGHMCRYCDSDNCGGQSCADGILAWLNAPAESEVNNG